MDESITADLLGESRRIAKEAGAAILEVAKGDAEVQEKVDGSPLTLADTASNKIIQSGLEKLEPVFDIISEESNPEQAALKSPDVFWLVDPLDGTKEFIKGLGEYTVNIALVESGRPIMGVIYVPEKDVLYFAGEGSGAFKEEEDCEPVTIEPSEGEIKTAVVSRSHLDEQTEGFLSRVGVSEVIRHGSSLKMCAVAEGSADIYPRFGPTCLWDTGAGCAIAREAGCRVVDLEGSELSYEPAGGLKQHGFLVYPLSLDGLVKRHIGPG